MENSSSSMLQVSKQLEQEHRNKVVILGGRIGLEAVEDKILIKLDPYKSGFECKTCGGEGVIKKCICVGQDWPAGQNRLGGPCKMCHGNYGALIGTDCLDCKGQGSLIVIPESAKQLPTSGIIVSAGPDCKRRKLGDRVLFGAHTGYFIPFKGNVKIRCMREDEILCLLYSKEQINLGDSISEEDMNNV